jgi:hypothetical protein
MACRVKICGTCCFDVTGSVCGSHGPKLGKKLGRRTYKTKPDLPRFLPRLTLDPLGQTWIMDWEERELTNYKKRETKRN